MNHHPPLARFAEDQPPESHAARAGESGRSQPRLDGSVPVDPDARPQPRAAFLSLPQPRLAETHQVKDYIAKLGCVAIYLDEHGDVTLTLWSEEQARALIAAAGQAAAMFAVARPAAKVYLCGDEDEGWTCNVPVVNGRHLGDHEAWIGGQAEKSWPQKQDGTWGDEPHQVCEIGKRPGAVVDPVSHVVGQVTA